MMDSMMPMVSVVERGPNDFSSTRETASAGAAACCFLPSSAFLALDLPNVRLTAEHLSSGVKLRPKLPWRPAILGRESADNFSFSG